MKGGGGQWRPHTWLGVPNGMSERASFVERYVMLSRGLGLG